DGDEHAYEIAMPLAQIQRRVVALLDVSRRREVRRRRMAERAEHGRQVTGNADALTGAESRGVHILPVAAPAPRVEKVRVRVDQRAGAVGCHAAEGGEPWSRRSMNAALAAASIARIASSS